MGYYVNITDGQVTIPANNLPSAYKRLCALNAHDHLKNGGSWSGGKQTERWFSWCYPDYPNKCEDTQAIFQMLGFETMTDSAGSLVLLGYDSKTGQEDLFLDTIADLCTDDSYLVWRGEDGAMWKDTYGSKRRHYDAQVDWVENSPSPLEAYRNVLSKFMDEVTK